MIYQLYWLHYQYIHSLDSERIKEKQYLDFVQASLYVMTNI